MKTNAFLVLVESVPYFGLNLEQEGKIVLKSNPPNIQLEYEEQKTD